MTGQGCISNECYRNADIKHELYCDIQPFKHITVSILGHSPSSTAGVCSQNALYPKDMMDLDTNLQN